MGTAQHNDLVAIEHSKLAIMFHLRQVSATLSDLSFQRSSRFLFDKHLADLASLNLDSLPLIFRSGHLEDGDHITV